MKAISQYPTYQTISPLQHGMRWGLMGGLAATLVMDLLLMGLFAAAGLRPLTCYIMIGKTIGHLFSLQGFWAGQASALGVAAHYLIGPLLGGLFGAVLAKIKAARTISRKKVILLAVLYTELLSQPLLALTPALLPMTTNEILAWYAGSFGMHLIWGCILGAITSKAR
jgi:hypothetical protein